MEKIVKKASRILIIDLLYLGDLIFTTPFLRNLRKNCPQVRLEMIVNADFYDIMKNNSYLDRVNSFNKRWSVLKSWQFARKLKRNNYDLGINLHGNWRSALLLKLINPQYATGFGGRGRGIFLDRKLKAKSGRHQVEVYLQVLEDLGLTVFDKRLEIDVSSAAITVVNNFLEKEGVTAKQKVIVINPGGSWPAKRWSVQNFAILADLINEEFNCQVIFTGSSGDLKRVNSIRSLMKTEAIIATGKTSLEELAALARSADLFISGDTGPVHVAAAVRTPTVTIFGPSNPQKYRPYGDPQKHKIVTAELECRPCNQQQCPQNHTHCMSLVTPQIVLKTIRKI